jgi:hypothetical protein
LKSPPSINLLLHFMLYTKVPNCTHTVSLTSPKPFPLCNWGCVPLPIDLRIYHVLPLTNKSSGARSHPISFIHCIETQLRASGLVRMKDEDSHVA